MSMDAVVPCVVCGAEVLPRVLGDVAAWLRRPDDPQNELAVRDDDCPVCGRVLDRDAVLERVRVAVDNDRRDHE